MDLCCLVFFFRFCSSSCINQSITLECVEWFHFKPKMLSVETSITWVRMSRQEGNIKETLLPSSCAPYSLLHRGWFLSESSSPPSDWKTRVFPRECSCDYRASLLRIPAGVFISITAYLWRKLFRTWFWNALNNVKKCCGKSRPHAKIHAINTSLTSLWFGLYRNSNKTLSSFGQSTPFSFF